MDPTHLRPVPPSLLRFLIEASGFEVVDVRRLHPTMPVSPPAARTRWPAGLREILCAPRDYAIVRPTRRLGPSMRIVLDLATSWFWTRPPVGIVRAERKFAQFLLAQPRCAIAFCRFDKTLGRHVTIEADVVRALLGRGSPRCGRNRARCGGRVRTAGSRPVTGFSGHAPRRPRRRARRFRSASKSTPQACAGTRMVFRLPEPLRPEALQALRAAGRCSCAARSASPAAT